MHIGMMMKDGDSLRFPTFPADSPLAWRNEMHQHFVARDAARSGTDASAVLVTDGSDDPWALHRPGPRYLADATARNAANAELAKAYAEYDADQSERWRGEQAQGAEFVAARDGQQCTVQGPEYPHDYGSPGHLRRLDGRLICVPDEPQPRRPPRDSMPTGDVATMARALADRMQQLYDEVDRLDAERWRNGK